MSRSQLRVGAEITLEGYKYRLIRLVEGDVWVLENLDTGRPLERSHHDLLRDYAEGALIFKRFQLVGIDGTPRSAAPSADALSPRELEESEMRAHYVRAVETLPRTRAVYEPAIRDAWVALGSPGKAPPYWNTVRLWVNSVEASGGSLLGLVSNYAGRGNRRPRIHPTVFACVDWVIETFYLTLERPTVQAAVDFAAGLIEKANKLLPPSQRLVPASRKFFQRLIGRIPDEDVTAARWGYEHARRKYRGNTKVRLTERPLERAEVDHGRLDIFVVDSDTGAPLGRPWISLLIDDNTRAVLGLHLSFTPPSRVSLAGLFKHAFLPKFEKDKYPNLTHEWFAYGVPAEISMDNGMEFHSEELRQICLELGIDVNWAARKQPWRKGKIERFIRSINRGLVALFPGKTFSSIFEKDDYDPTQHAVLSLKELKAVLVKWHCDVYHQRPHSAIGCSPAEKWRNGIKPSDIDMVPDITRLDAVIGARFERVLDQGGIDYESLQYNCEELNELRRKEGGRVNVKIRVDRENLGSIVVLLPRTEQPLRVPCTRPDYAEGLTLWQHNLCRQYARRNRKHGNSGASMNDWKIAHAEICLASLKLLKERGVKREKSRGTVNARWVEAMEALLPGDPLDIFDTTPVLPPPSLPTNPTLPAVAKAAPSIVASLSNAAAYTAPTTVAVPVDAPSDTPRASTAPSPKPWPPSSQSEFDEVPMFAAIVKPAKLTK